jgi:hypothetical protein
VAWASVGFTLFDDLQNYSNRIKQLVVGTHFYQTHPEFIKIFHTHPNVRFIMSRDGVFHPKIYLFENDPTDWVCVIGSPNFSASAYSQNTEAAVVFDSQSGDAGAQYATLITELERHWGKAINLSEEQIRNYTDRWRNALSHRKTMGLTEEGSLKSSIDQYILNIGWDQYIERVKNNRYRNLEGRLGVLEAARDLFMRHGSFSQMSEEERRDIAGYGAENGPLNWKLFGSMRGAGTYKGVIKANSEYISAALDHIPIEQPVSRDDYTGYVETFRKAFPDGGDGLAVATRLLCMKRPDVFVCLDSKNRSALAAEFGIPRYVGSYQDYWEKIIVPVQRTDWWKSRQPENPKERAIWRGRTALLDALFYKK